MKSGGRRRRLSPRIGVAWLLLVGSTIGWPLSAFTFARGEPVTVLGLSWVAIWIAALDVLFTAQVHDQQNGDQQDGERGKGQGVRRGGDGGMRSNYRDPPGRWGGATNAGGDVYFRLDVEAEDVLGTVVVWHWCPAMNLWRAANPGEHELVSAAALHLEPSLLWGCCDRHGWIRGGRWVDA